jgi:acyl carrier protein
MNQMLGGISRAMKSETPQGVIELVAEQTGVSPSRISAATRIGEDLGVDGDDAADLLTEFASRFHVDLAGFQFPRHFGPEAGWSPFYALYCLLTGRGRTEPVTVQQLAEAAERGVWSYAA